MIAIQKPEGALPYFMKRILDRLKSHDSLTYEEAKEVLTGITNGMVNDSQVAAFLTAFIMRQVTLDELAGFRDALMEQVIKINLPAAGAIDIVGTGGDGKNTFNISTLSSFVVAGAGYKVIKHGNYGTTSISGSSDVLEYLGYQFTPDESVLSKQLEQAGICFLHAPLFHPAMKRVAAIRRNIGLRTFFNLIGPLTNPARPGFLLLGAASAEQARMFHYLLQDTAITYKVVHALDGYDELSLTANARIYSRIGDRVATPEELGHTRISHAELLAGKDVKSAATIFLNVLENKATIAQQQVVIANSAMAIHCFNETIPFEDCTAQATASLASGKAYEAFKKSIQIY
ncbi:MAG: anthranilate phosphoribosyltransferase [Taibaiella sp.]|jgi:anthranilate phosphoribosyltransferase